MRKLLVLAVLLFPPLAFASVNVQLSLDDDAVVVAKRECARDAGASCSNAQASAWLSDKVNQRLLAEARNRQAKEDLESDGGALATARARFAAMTTAEQNAVCKFLGKPDGCTP